MSEPDASFDIPHIEPAPRAVPALLKMQVWFGGFCGTFGWLFTGFGLVFFWIFVLNAEFFAPPLGSTNETHGTVVTVEPTNMSVNDRKVYAVHFKFQDDDNQWHQGVAYRTGKPKIKGRVKVEYSVADPSRSRIPGLRRALFGNGVMFAVIFPGIGLVFVLISLVRGRRRARLLRHGTLTVGGLVGKQPTNTRINNRMVYKLTFGYLDQDGQGHETSTRTHMPESVEDEPYEKIFYDPLWPERAIVMDGLPGHPTINADGRMGTSTPVAGILVAIPPLLCVVGHGLVLLSKLS